MLFFLFSFEHFFAHYFTFLLVFATTKILQFRVFVRGIFQTVCNSVVICAEGGSGRGGVGGMTSTDGAVHVASMLGLRTGRDISVIL